MTNPLHADYYADNAVQHKVTVVENVHIADETYRCRFRCPEMAQRFLPGQFLMVRMFDGADPLIGRPFALYDVVADESGQPTDIDFVYLVEGKLTSCLANVQPGSQLEVWGPLGNGFIPRPCRHLIMVAGGIGQTPFLAVAKERLGNQASASARDSATVETATLCYGARTAGRLAGLDDFAAAGLDVKIATDDGSQGHHGFVTDLLNALLDAESAGAGTDDVHILCCGPEPMMHAVSEIAKQRGVSCEVSLEEPMACGIGICFTCVAKICDDSGEWDYKRTCVSGPVYDAKKVVWS